MLSVSTVTDGPCDLWTSHYLEHVTRIEPSAVMAVSSVPEVREQRERFDDDDDDGGGDEISLSRNIIKQCLNILISFVKPAPSRTPLLA